MDWMDGVQAAALYFVQAGTEIHGPTGDVVQIGQTAAGICGGGFSFVRQCVQMRVVGGGVYIFFCGGVWWRLGFK